MTGPAVAAGPRFLNGYNERSAATVSGQVAAGPRFLNGYNGIIKAPASVEVAAGPRFLNGYNLGFGGSPVLLRCGWTPISERLQFSGEGSGSQFVAAGPRFLNGYNLKLTWPDLCQLRLDPDF